MSSGPWMQQSSRPLAPPVSSGFAAAARFRNQTWSLLGSIPMPVTCCMPHLFGSHLGQNGSTLKMGAPPSSSACAGRACECSPRLKRTTTTATSPRTLAALRIGDLQTGGSVFESPHPNKADLKVRLYGPRDAYANVEAGLQACLPRKRRKTNRDGVERGIGLRPGALEVVDHCD